MKNYYIWGAIILVVLGVIVYIYMKKNPKAVPSEKENNPRKIADTTPIKSNKRVAPPVVPTVQDLFKGNNAQTSEIAAK